MDNERSYEKDIVARVKKLPHQEKMHVMGGIMHEDKTYPLFALEFGKLESSRPRVLLSSGVHGDENASIFALLDFLENDMVRYLPHFNFLVFPCLNPGGYELNIRTNPRHIDINRNFFSETPESEVREHRTFLEKYGKDFMFSVDLHEDPTDEPVPGFDPENNPRDFYLYEASISEERFGPALVMRLESEGVGISKIPSIYGDQNENGVVWTNLSEGQGNVNGSFDQYLRRFVRQTFVPETPTCWKYADRTRAHRLALKFLLEEFSKRIA